MYYIGIKEDDSQQLIYYCRNCKHVDETISAGDGICVLNSHLKKNEQKFDHIINEYTKMDPTLPRVYNITCPDPECKTEKGVIYLRYNNDDLKYIYLCAECDTTWKTDDKH